MTGGGAIPKCPPGAPTGGHPVASSLSRAVPSQSSVSAIASSVVRGGGGSGAKPATWIAMRERGCHHHCCESYLGYLILQYSKHVNTSCSAHLNTRGVFRRGGV